MYWFQIPSRWLSARLRQLFHRRWTRNHEKDGPLPVGARPTLVGAPPMMEDAPPILEGDPLLTTAKRRLMSTFTGANYQSKRWKKPKR